MRRTDGATASTWRRVLSASVIAAVIGAALVPFGLATPAEAVNGDVSGTVFNDYNHDGLQTAATGSGNTAVLGDPGVAGVWVRAYNSAGAAVGSPVQTAANGTYTLALGASSGTAVRIEFETPAGYESSRAPLATMNSSNNSSVRFRTIPATTATENYAIQQPGDYCQANPTLCSSIFPWDTATASDLNATGLVTMPYPETYQATTPDPTITALQTAVGPVYGIAYDQVTATTFMSSFLRRKAPFRSTLAGNDQTAAIFKDTSAATSLWANLNTLFPDNVATAGVDESPGGVNPHPSASTTWINDDSTPTLIGKRGLGDLDISNDGLWLYSVGLNNRTVYKIPSTVTPTAANITAWPLDLSTVPDANCPDGEVRPFGLGVAADDTVFLGGVCTGEGSANIDSPANAANFKLRYFVWTISPAGVYTLVLNYAIPYREFDVNKEVTPDVLQPRWNRWDFVPAWLNSNRDLNNNDVGDEVHPQPMLSDIEFVGNDLVLGIRDRYGDQSPGSARTAESDPWPHGHGDIMRACLISGSYVFEGNGVSGCDSGTDNEWFGNDASSDSWFESASGALAVLPTEPGVITTAYDPRSYTAAGSTTPVTNIIYEHGLENLQKTATAVTNAHLGSYAAFVNTDFAGHQWGKTNGMGDLEALCDSAPLEIGNRIWNDTDRDGIQDAGEAGISGVTVGLYNAAGTGSALGTAVTNANGEYYFSTDTARNSTAGDNIGAGLAFRTGYTIRVGTTANYAVAGPLNGMVISAANVASTETFTGRSDTLDSDAALVDTSAVDTTNALGTDIFPVVTVDSSTTNPGENDHTYDVGFNVPIVYTAVDLALQKTFTSLNGILAAGSGTVTFTITVTNQGSVSVNPVVVTDYINTAHFSALAVTDTLTVPISGGPATATWSTGATPSITLPSALAAGASATIPITLRVNPTALVNPLTNTVLTNRAEISSFDTDNTPGNGNSANGQVYDIDSVADALSNNEGTEKDDVTNEARYVNTGGTTGTPSATLDEDDADIASVPIYDLALIKDLAPSETGYVHGPLPDTVGFDITVTNQGLNTNYNIRVQDRPESDMSIVLAPPGNVTTQNITSSLSNARVVTYGATDYWDIDQLLPGESVKFRVYVDVITNGTSPYVNVAEITAFDNDASKINVKPSYVQDVDSTPANNIASEDDQDNAQVVTRQLVIGSTLFFDTDRDGDADVRASAGILVQLLNSSGTVIDTAVTDAGGNYYFDGVTEGSYRVGVPTTQTGAGVNPAALTGYTSMPGFSATPSAVNTMVGGTNDDGDVATGWLARSALFSMVYDGYLGTSDATDRANAVTYLGTPVPEETANLNIDFIFQPTPTYRVGNLVWLDANNNGVIDGAEVGVDGVTVNLYTSANALVGTTTTAGGGHYLFSSLAPGDYYVQIPAAEFLLGGDLYGWRASTGGGIEADPDSNVDNNSNATQSTPTALARTANLTLGSPTDVFDASEPTNETDSDSWTDGNNRSNISVDLGFYRPLRIGSTLFFDNNMDGTADVRAPAGILVQLINGSGAVVDAVVTDAGGNYFFENVQPGTYRVGIPTVQSGGGVNPTALMGKVSIPGFSATPSAANTLEGGTNDDGEIVTNWLARSAPFTMAFGVLGGNHATDLTNAATYLATVVPDDTANLNIDFIFQSVPTYRVGNLVWLDTNNNGIIDGAETGIDGVTVQLYTSANVLVGTTTTASGGHYTFSSLGAGDYYVQIPATQFVTGAPLAGWFASTGGGIEADPDSDVDNNSNATQAGPTTLAKTANFTLGSLTDPVDASEPINETDTDTWADGNNRSNLSVDLGFYQLLRIGSTLFIDTDRDGDADARAGAGIEVQLLDSTDAVVDSTLTDAGGNYFFAGVMPGVYRVGIPDTETAPGGSLEGYISKPGTSATLNANTLEGDSDDDGALVPDWAALSAQFTMAFGTHGGNAGIDLTNAEDFLGTAVPDETANLNIDFIFQPVPTYRVGNLVWFDTNNNGLVDGAESGIDGVTVQLYTSANVFVGSVVTSSGGSYEFGPLAAGNYYVQIPATQFDSGQPLFGLRASSGLGFEADPDSDDDNNSNAIQGIAPSPAFTANFTLGSLTDVFDASEPTDETDTDVWTDGNNRSNLSVDLGFHEPLRIGSTIFLDTDKDGDADVRAPAGIRVSLLNSAGSVMAVAVTDAGGNYFFDGLDAGLYQVAVPVNQTGLGLNPAALSGYYSVPGASSSPSVLNTMIGDADDDGASDIGNGWRAITVQFPLSYGAHAGNDPVDLASAVTYLGTARADMNSDLNIDFIFQPVPTYRVGNLVWLDRDNDGVFDVGTESGIDGVTVELLTPTDDLVATTVTSGGGYYAFETLAAGNYYVRIPSFEFISGGDLIGLRASTGAGVEADPDSDVDSNSNAIQAGPLAAATTAGFTLGSPSDPFDTSEPINEDDTDTWTDGNNRSNLSVDLGLYEPLRIGSTLFFDNDDDAVADVRAPDGILVQLLDGAGVVVASSVTDAGGNYFFGDLAPGTYQVAIPTTQVGSGVNSAALTGYITVPGASASPEATNTMVGDAGDDGALDLGNGWLSITAQFTMSYIGNGGNDATDLTNATTFLGTPVSDASANLNIDFIFRPLPTYRVGNLVWRDTNNNGIVDGAETGVDGVTVELYTSLGVLVDTTTTSAGGHYLFETLQAGVYYVQIPAAEFAGALLGLRASTGAGIEANPDLDVDNNSNATQASPGDLAKTGNFTLGSATDPLDASEPTNETDSDTWVDGNNRSNLSVDLGFYEPLRVGSLVWNDNGWDGFTSFTLANDDNGIADFGEYGIGGVEVELWRDVVADGVFEPAGADFTGFVGTTTTTGTGSYLFDNLEAGSYFVVIPSGQAPLSTLRSSTPNTNGGSPELVDDDDDGIAATGGYVVKSGVIVLSYGAEPATETGDFGFGDSEATADTLAGSTKADTSSQLFIDFGFSPNPLYRIGNIVWRDYDDNGVLNTGEPGLSGLTVELYEDNGATPNALDGTDSLIGSTTTALDGSYGFDNLEGGNYLIHVPSQSALTDWRTAGTPVANANGDVDNDNNAVVDGGGGWTSGRVVLGGAAGPADHAEPVDEIDGNTGVSAEDDVTWRDDRSNQTVDFGFFAGLRLGNQVWLDEGAGGNLANGVFDADEYGLVGITVLLWRDSGNGIFNPIGDTYIGSATTDVDGNYFFDHLEAGNYFAAVPEAGSPSMVSSPGTVGTGLADDNVDDGAPKTGYLAVTDALPLAIGAAPTAELDTTPLGDDLAETEADAVGDDYRDADSYLTVDLGFTGVATYRIGNLVWADWDNDGKAESTEPGISEVLVQLLDSSGTVIGDTATDSNGFYEFTGLVAGDYSIYIPVAQTGAGVDPSALTGFFSSSVTQTLPNTNVDNDDNGVDDIPVSTLAGWGSGVITLGDNTSDEPTDETRRSDNATDDDSGQLLPRIDDDYSNYSVDFGFYSLSIGNHVWLDVTNNDVFDNGVDLPAVGVTVELRDAITNDLLQTTTTDADGLYLFVGLIDWADYRVVIPAANFAPGGVLEGWYQTSGWATSHQNPDGRDGGIDAALYADVVSIDMEAAAGAMPIGENGIEDLVNDFVRPDSNNNLFVDFSFSNWTPTYRVGNLVWLDTDNNGLVNGTEAGIDGVTVDLLDSAGVFVATTTTSGGGHYEFDTLEAGDYLLRIPASEFTAGALQGLRASSNGVEFDPDSDVDNNSNALQSAPTALAFTSHFTLGAPADPFDASEPTNETDSDTWVDGDGRSNLSVDLGFYQPLRVGSLVWFDDGFDGTSAYTLSNDDNGVADNGELGVSGLSVQLWLDEGDHVFSPLTDTLVATTITNVDGSYLFDDRAPGDYFVAIPAGELPLVGWRSSSPDSNAGLPEATDDDDDGIVAPGYAGVTGEIQLDYGTEPTNETGDFGSGNSETLANTLGGAIANNNSQLFVDFGFSPMPTYRIANLVWRDLDDDGVAGSGESGLDGLTVELYRVGTLTAIATTTTAGGGRYEFSGLPAGDYQVHIPTQTALDDWRTAGTPVANADGNVDNDNNAVEDGTTGWTSGVVTLGGAAGPADHAEPTGEVDGTTGLSAEGAGERDDRSNQTVDFGFFAGLRLGNQVWFDDGAGTNLDNGIFDTDESGLAGVAVQLWLDDGDAMFDDATDTLVESTSTNSEGNYWFDHIEAGDYFVALPAFSGALSSTGTVGLGLADDNVDDGAPQAGYVAVSGLLSLTIGGAPTGEADVSPTGDGSAETEADGAGSSYRDIDSYLTADFGITGVPLYRLGNRVWADWNNDGIATSSEPGISGVLVQLRDSANVLVAETVTNAAGFYSFAGLVEGDYTVFIPRDQLVDGTLPIGSPAIIPTALSGFLSATTTVTNPNTDVDNDDNGLDQFTGPTLVGWSSAPVTLTGTADEPTNETLRSNDATDDDLGQTGPRIDDDRSNYSVDFGFYSISVGNHLWLDLANDGVYNPGTDQPAVGVTLELRDSVTDTLVSTATTDASGLYLFTGMADDASYVIVIPGDNFDLARPLAGWYPSNGSVSAFTTDGRDHGLNVAHFADVLSDPFTVNAGAMPLGENATDDLLNDTVRPDANTNLYLDFSFYRMELGGVVFFDPTNNGHDDADGYFANVTLLLYNGNGTPFLRANGVQATTTTNAGGHYVFLGLPTGTFIVEIPASEFTQELDALGSSDGNNVSGAAPLTDSDDLSEDNGNPVNGNLFGGGAVRSSVVTLTIDSELTTDPAPTPGVPNPDSNLAVDFGFWMVQSNLELGNQIWFDTDKDGVYDIGTELPSPAGVIIELHDGVTGALVATTTTNVLGQYLFTGLVAGTYYLELPTINFVNGHPLAGYIATTGPGVSSTPTDGLDLDSNGQTVGALGSGGIRTGIVSLWAQLPTLEVDGWVTVNDDRLSDLTVDFGLVQLDTLAFTGADLEHPAAFAFWLILLGLLLLLLTRYGRKRRQSNSPLPR